MDTRLYVVSDTKDADKEPDRLVLAGSQAQAIRHAAARYSAKPASPQDVARLMAAGVRVETANGSAT